MITIGNKAPHFEGTIDASGKTVKLEDYSGKKLVLFFYPKDNTPGCTAEACSLRDSYAELRDKGFELLGVSTDDVKSHQKFKEKFNLPYDLIADVDRKIVEDYGVWGEKKFMGKTFDGIHRTTVVIDEKGMVEKIFDKVNTNDHATQILESYL